jgi:hypothetical protein
MKSKNYKQQAPIKTKQYKHKSTQNNSVLTVHILVYSQQLMNKIQLLPKKNSVLVAG